jgi:transposase InsO family protein
MTDRRCRFGLAAKIEMIRRRQRGESFRQIARSMACSPTTVKTAWDRWQSAEAGGREDFSCLLPRRPIPRSCPWSLTVEQERQILEARAKTNWGPMRLTVICNRHRATIYKVLKRHGVARRRRSERQTFKRYEWAESGALLHLDAFQAPKFDRPGHWAGGDRAEANRTRGAGTTYVIGVVDDHTRLAYCELHSGETAQAVSQTLKRAVVWFAQQGCGPVEAVMTDNALCYARSRQFRDTLTQLQARHILIPPRTPRWNGKVERFFQTLDTEWAHGRIWQNSHQRDRALSSFLRFYNRRRPHSAADGRAPITRVH